MSLWAALGTAALNMFSANQANDFSHHMAKHQFRHAAEDAEAAGLNRILAFGNAAAAPAGQQFQVPDFARIALETSSVKQAIATGKAQEDLLRANADATEAQAAKTRTETMNMNEMLPFLKQQIASGSHRDDTQAALNDLNAVLAGLEGDKQEVLKGLYRELGPVALELFKVLGSSAKSGFGALEDLSRTLQQKVGEFTNSAKGQKVLSPDDPQWENIAQSIVREVEEGKLSKEKLKDLNDSVREHVYRMRPKWR